MSQEYVVGFMFSYDLSKVALIEKKRPKWQAGLLNGVGGHKEKDESILSTMIREFEEETGMLTFPHNWSRYARISEYGSFSVHCFASRGSMELINSPTDEIVVVTKVKDLYGLKLVDNCRWLIPMALDHLEDGRPEYGEIYYPRRS